ncbi:MAG: hypothetical protein KKC18_06450, partial [Chloroflexi bacterium]|nr:hypothetical protein [Chloroflexota bacterium]
TGACCHVGGSCTVETPADCGTAGGTYWGNDTSCSPNPCPQPRGACCFPPLYTTCVFVTPSGCDGYGGVYRGDDVTCTPTNPCPPPTGACCHPDGSCTIGMEADCGTAGGTYWGDDTLCDPNPCPLPWGACCYSGGSCTEGSPTDCATAGGVYEGNGTTCTPNPCVQSCPGSFVYGDMDGDEDVDGEDIQAFTDAIMGASREASDVCPGDFDGSLIVDPGDIPGMVAALLE